jgi:hypothetical protein
MTIDHATRRKAFSRPSILNSLARIVGCTFGALVLFGCVPCLYCFVPTIVYPTLCHSQLMDSTLAVLLGVGPFQFGGEAIVALLLFHYLARLRPHRLSFSGREFRLKPSNTLQFWIPLLALLAFVNQQTISGSFSGPATLFDFVLFALLFVRYGPELPKRFHSDEKIALFLRPFGTFSDRSLIRAVLRGLPAGYQAVFLVPKHQSLAFRDPFTLGLSGFRMVSPIRSSPLTFITEDSEWELAIRKLIPRSGLIFVDVTDRTSSLQHELRLLNEMAAQDRTILLSGAGAESQPHGNWLGVINFQKSLQPFRFVGAIAVSLFLGVGLAFQSAQMLGWRLQGSGHLTMAACVALVVLAYALLVIDVRGVRGKCQELIQETACKREGNLPYAGDDRQITLVAVGLTAILLPICLFPTIGILNHAMVGMETPGGKEIALVFDQGDHTYNQELQELQRRLPAVQSAAQWRMLPATIPFEIQETSYWTPTVAWMTPDWGVHSTAAIKIRLKAKYVAPKVGERPALCFVLHQFHVEKQSDSTVKLLYDTTPIAPMKVGDDLVWAVQHWEVHEDFFAGFVPVAREVGVSLGLLFLPILLACLGFWLLQH